MFYNLDEEVKSIWASLPVGTLLMCHQPWSTAFVLLKICGNNTSNKEPFQESAVLLIDSMGASIKPMYVSRMWDIFQFERMSLDTDLFDPMLRPHWDVVYPS